MGRVLYFVGTAGSGKTTMVHAFDIWMQQHGYDTVLANLDPGAEGLPYDPDVDIKDWVSLKEVMEDYGLGPNGAQVLAADMLALNIQEVAEVLDTFRTDYVLIDTPGQMELFTFRASSRAVVEALGEEAFLVYLTDPALAKSPSGLVSSLLLSATTQFRHSLPFLNVLSKSDLLTEEELQRTLKWSSDPYDLYDALLEERSSSKALLDVEFLKALESTGVYRRLTPISSELMFGFEDLYTAVQQTFQGGEDIERS